MFSSNTKPSPLTAPTHTHSVQCSLFSSVTSVVGQHSRKHDLGASIIKDPFVCCPCLVSLSPKPHERRLHPTFQLTQFLTSNISTYPVLKTIKAHRLHSNKNEAEWKRTNREKTEKLGRYRTEWKRMRK